MARDLNHATLIGRLVRDPEIKFAQSGTAICKISVANNDNVKKDGNWTDEVSYFDVVVFGKQGENVEKYCKKGSQVAIEGRLRQNRWTDQATQQTRSKIEIVASSIQFLGGNGEQRPVGNNDNSDNNHLPNQDNQGYNKQLDDDCPF